MDLIKLFSFFSFLSFLTFREELQSYQRELEVLSEQYSQKCLENAHLAQALEAERQALTQCQRENQELNAHNQVTIYRHQPTQFLFSLYIFIHVCELRFNLTFYPQELNNRLTAEITRMRSCFSGETALSPLTQGKDLYELEVCSNMRRFKCANQCKCMNLSFFFVTCRYFYE